MLNMNEKRILEILAKRHLATKSELNSLFSQENLNGTDISMGRLRDRGYIDQVPNLGNCIIITKLGLQALEEDK